MQGAPDADVAKGEAVHYRQAVQYVKCLAESGQGPTGDCVKARKGRITRKVMRP